MIDFLVVFGAMIFFLMMQAFFSGSEMAMVSIEKAYLRHQAAMGSRGAKYALSMLIRPDWMLATTLIGTNIAVVANTTIVTAYSINIFGDKGSLIALLVLMPLVWLFAEIIPKSVFQQKSHQLVPVVIYGLWLFSFIVSPIVMVFSFISRVINRNSKEHTSPFIQREELISMMSTPDVIEGDIKEIEKDMIQRVFDFSETNAVDAMTPIDKVDSVSIEATIGEALQISQSVNHIRLPVYDQKMDNIVGLLHTLEILGEPSELPIRDFIQPNYITQFDTSIAELLSELRANKSLVAMVNKGENTLGLISLEDIMEEVVADIEDEYDSDFGPQVIRQLGARNYLVSARIAPSQLEQELKLDIQQTSAASLAGLLLEHFNEIPSEGASVEINKVCYTVNKASPQAILDVQITW